MSAGEAAALLSLRNVVGQYRTAGGPVIAIDGLDLDIARGQALCVVGRSGSGKTTLLDIIGTLLRPARGEYLFAGRSVQDLPEAELAGLRNRHLGFVFQAFHLIEHLSVRDNITLPGRYGRRADLTGRVADLMGRLGLNGLADRLPAQLSGGQRQRVAIARALVRDPDVVLADEPTGSLDSATARDVLTLLRRAMGASRTLVLVTHDPQIADGFDQVIELRDGRIVGRPR